MNDWDWFDHEEYIPQCSCGNETSYKLRCTKCNEPVCEECQERFGGICLECAEKEAPE